MKLHTDSIKGLINDWIKASNAFDAETYLTFYSKDAILDDPSVGKKFAGLAGIKNYFDTYFIGYNTHTKLITLNIKDNHHAHLEVLFTGNFPERKVTGTFDFTFTDGKITFITANLI